MTNRKRSQTLINCSSSQTLFVCQLSEKSVNQFWVIVLTTDFGATWQAALELQPCNNAECQHLLWHNVLVTTAWITIKFCTNIQSPSITSTILYVCCLEHFHVWQKKGGLHPSVLTREQIKQHWKSNIWNMRLQADSAWHHLSRYLLLEAEITRLSLAASWSQRRAKRPNATPRCCFKHITPVQRYVWKKFLGYFTV